MNRLKNYVMVYKVRFYCLLSIVVVDRQPVIEKIQRISKPGLRVYSSSKKMPRVLGGFGTAIISTSRGLMTDRQARSEGIGGEDFMLYLVNLR